MISVAAKHMYLLTLLHGINFWIDVLTAAILIIKKI